MTTNRQPKGTAVGGQFAGTTHAEFQTALYPERRLVDDRVGATATRDLTPAQSAAQRVESALAQWNDPDDAQTRIRDMLTDLRHYAAANSIDLEQALDGSYRVFLEEHNDPAFTEGL